MTLAAPPRAPDPPLSLPDRPAAVRRAAPARWGDDPRVPFAVILTTYVVMGTAWLGFNRSPGQIAIIVSAGCALDMGMHWILRRRELLVPLSAYISSLSIAILLNFAHDPWLLFLPVFLTIASKYVFTIDGRHHFNPSLFGVATTLLLAGHLITTAPAYQWGGSWAMSAFIVTAALATFVFRTGRGWLIGSFLLFYTLQTALRAWIMRAHLPPEMLFLGTLTSPPFFLFTFFMLTDPRTSPAQPRHQVALAFAIATVDLYLHKLQSVYTFFYAAFAVACVRFVWLQARAAWHDGAPRYLKTRLLRRFTLRSAGLTALLATAGGWTYHTIIRPHVTLSDAGFVLQSVPSARTGVTVTMDPGALDLVDPRLRHIAKWILSVGASVEVGDVDGDGLPDLFLTNPLAVPGDRVALYRNLGGFRFERVPLPALDALRGSPARHGLPAGALFLDYDNDGDPDLFVDVSFGRTLLLRNERGEEGAMRFSDVTDPAGAGHYVISASVNALDFDRDGRADLMIGNALDPHLRGYSRPTTLNIFDLPPPAYEGDRRMFAFMHNGWHNADNGGRNVLLHNRGDGSFEEMDLGRTGMPETHWTIAIGTGDLNADGWTDLYLASDFGHDDLYLNEHGTHWRRVEGSTFSDVGRDTYKGMNSSIADINGDGLLDVYVSNVHHALQAEGSLLWINRGNTADGTPRLVDEASRRGALNEDRFGWGAAVADFANRGWLDIAQANGMVDDRFDRAAPGCPDYWYVNHKLMQSTSEIHTYADMWGDLRGRCIYPDEQRRLYLNRGAGARPQFVDVAGIVGLTRGENSRGIAVADFDNDGRVDVIIANQHAGPEIFRNVATPPAAGNAWIGLRLQGDGHTCTRDALGSTVTVIPDGGRRQVREVQAANGFAAQHDGRLHFGLGRDAGDSVTVAVRWCGATGPAQPFRLATNRYHRLVQ